ncbi:Mog1p/PsbP-like protein [Mycena capillaripes]|nr:Mog1p/PsbP-like protein [Mycena capillaripes]
MSSSPRELFGGAITAVVPITLVDASDLRQVPDTQEVLLYPDSGVSIIVEVLQRVDTADDDSAIRYHFDSLAHDNSARSFAVDTVGVISNTRGDKTPPAITLSGVQSVAKFNKEEQDQVRVLMALFRVEDKRVDLVVTFNVPMESQDSGAVDAAGWNTVLSDFDAFVRFLCIVDFGLFV